MATPIEPKSEVREFHGIIRGYAEIPAIEQGDGTHCWRLPTGEVICDYNKAFKEAGKLDKYIRRQMELTQRILH
jgi:hypothetical protein